MQTGNTQRHGQWEGQVVARVTGQQCQSPDWHPRGSQHKPHIKSKLQEVAHCSPSQQPPSLSQPRKPVLLNATDRSPLAEQTS